MRTIATQLFATSLAALAVAASADTAAQFLIAQGATLNTNGGPRVRMMAPMSVAPQTETQKMQSEAAMWLPADAAPSHAVRATLRDAAKAGDRANETGDRHKKQIIGADRQLAAPDARIALYQLAWTSFADGSKAARVRIQIEGATSVRLGYRVEGGLAESALRFAGTDLSVAQAGVSPLSESAVRWTGVFDGDVVTIDVRLSAGEVVDNKVIVIEHAVGLDVKSDLSKRESDIGSAESCNSDVACVTNPTQALIDATRSVTKLLFQSAGFTTLCSGTLIANTNRRPLIYTASHCISTQAEADSLTTYWGFQAATCGSRAIPSSQRITNPSSIRFTDQRIDVTLLDMNIAPPSNALLSGWNADLGRRGEAVTALHHPSGDLMKYTTGRTVGYVNANNLTADPPLQGDRTSSYWSNVWDQGSTEGGSSGSGLFTFAAPGALCSTGCYLLRGTLSQGSASCKNPTGDDKYGRLDLALPYIASFLDTNQLPFAMNGEMATEYYNVTNDHYFVTADPAEANSLDQPNLRITGWYRTGEQFGVYKAGTAGTSPVCRFFGDLPVGGPNSHFYTADAGECGVVARPNSGWKRESADAFRVALPTGNVCPTGTKALYRMYNYHNTPTYRNTLTGQLGFDSNHRYFTDTTYFNIMQEKDAWNLEPSGRVPLMCVR